MTDSRQGNTFYNVKLKRIDYLLMTTQLGYICIITLAWPHFTGQINPYGLLPCWSSYRKYNVSLSKSESEYILYNATYYLAGHAKCKDYVQVLPIKQIRLLG